MYSTMQAAPQQPTPLQPQQQTLHRAGSNDSFVCNVSDDEVPERDIDLEIEARIRSASQLTAEPGTLAYQQQQWVARDRATSIRTLQRTGPSTLSQRMLSKLQKNKKQAAMHDMRSKRIGSTQLEVVHADRVLDDHIVGSGSNGSMSADFDGLVVADPFYDPSQDPVYMSSSDDEAPNISHSITSSVGRLEARISERRLQNKTSMSSRPDSLSAPPTEGNELSVMYTNRRTYPAEAAKKVDTRFSVDGRTQPQPSQHEIRAMHAGIHTPQRPVHMDPTVENTNVLDANKSLPVAFHFQGKSDTAHEYNRNGPVPVTSSRTQPIARHEDPYVALTASLNQIEEVVGGLEVCFDAGSVASLASAAIRQLELLRDSTTQIRTNGTSLILAEIGRPHSTMLGHYRQLVARAASLQKRIESLINHCVRLL